MHSDDWQDIFTTHDPLELAAVVGLLDQEGIRTRVRDLSVTPYPVNVGLLAEKRILVPPGSAERARALILQAVADGFLPSGAGAVEHPGPR